MSELSPRTDSQPVTPPEAFVSLSPSVKFVYYVLRDHGELTNREIAEKTWLPDRTVRWALRRLEEIDGVRSRPSDADARQKLYRAVAFQEMGVVGDE